MDSKIKYIIFILLVASLIPLCAQKQVTHHPINNVNKIKPFKFNLTKLFYEVSHGKLVDDTGHPIVVKGIPHRIVSLAPSNTEILFAIGAGKQVVGVTDYCDYPPQAVKLKKEGVIKSIGGFTTVNIERVLALKPDLVVAAYGNGLQTIQTLRSLGLNVVAFNPKNVTDVMKDILILGKITGHFDQAKKVVEEMAKKIEFVVNRVRGLKKVRVAHILWHDPIWVSGRDTFVNQVIELAGGVNVFNFTGWRIVSIEDLIAANPQVIIVNSGSGMGQGKKNVIYQWVMTDKRLKCIDAVKHHRVYVINADIISRPSYRLADAVEIIAKWLHPEAFANVTVTVTS